MSSNLIDEYFDAWYQILEHLRDGISSCIHHRWSMYYHLLCPMPCFTRRMSNHHKLHYSELFSSISLPFSILQFFLFSKTQLHHFILLDPSSVLFSWLGTFGLSNTGSPGILFSAFPQQFHSFAQFHKYLQNRITYYFKIKILVTLFWRKSFSHFIPTDRI